MGDLSMKIMEMKIGSFLIACRFPLPPPPSEGNTQWLLLCTIGNCFDRVWFQYKTTKIGENIRNDNTIIFHKEL
ncbi:RIKEN cDNA A930016P21, putative [Brugia malayi]|uniref:Uncharacterized protein n=1 Tax=Brugia malayi TaxID=6279 RepID=A0A4E9F1Y6_BRUMA|nr:RIKEN cDNA A930016P21, putative [Brugia malayi]VIO90688.1 RIKEN cDNA A930016P21, putative [Brugia malayi]